MEDKPGVEHSGYTRGRVQVLSGASLSREKARCSIEKEYMTLDEAAKAVGLKRSSLYYYLDKLKIERKQFPFNRHRWIAAADVERIRAAKERPWELEEDTAKRPAVDKDAA